MGEQYDGAYLTVGYAYDRGGTLPIVDIVAG